MSENDKSIEYTQYLNIRDTGPDSDGAYHIDVDLEAKHLSRAGLVHGGMIMTLLDAAIGRAVMRQVPEKHTAPTVELKINFFRPAASGKLKAIGRIVNKGKTLCYAEGEVLNEEGKLIAKASGSFFVKPL